MNRPAGVSGSTPNPAILLRAVGFRRGGFRLGPVDLEVGTGDIVALLGPSGGGKTTLLHLVAGLLAPDSGSVHVGGRLVAGPDVWVPPHARGLALLLQEGAHFEHLGLEANLRAVLRARGRDPGGATGWLDRVGLGGRGPELPGALSGGQRQRLGLAMVLAAGAPVVLLDEPGARLDRAAFQGLAAVVSETVRRGGATVLAAAHELRALEGLGVTRILDVADGRVRQDGGGSSR